MKIKTIITGATGMVGEGVLHECLKHPQIESVLVINRRSCGIKNDKLKEIIHTDFHDFSGIENQLSGYNACYFCMGVSSLGMKEEAYRKITYDITLRLAKTLLDLNPDMTFCYVSGLGTDSSENGRIMWARVKGKTENDLLNLGFKAAYMFRPGFIQPIKGLKNTYKIYRFISFIIPLIKKIFPKHVCSLEDLGLSMINVVISQPKIQILGNKEITEIAK